MKGSKYVEYPTNGKLGEVFRHELITYNVIMKKADFLKTQIKFDCELDPVK